MKNTKFLFILAISSFLVIATSCNNKCDHTTSHVEVVTVNGDTARIFSSYIEIKKGNEATPNSIPVVKESEVHPYRNPVFIYGSSFGEFFQTLYKTGKFEDMLKFTSSMSMEKFGRDKVLNFYKTMDFAYNIKLKSMNAVETPIDVTTLNYEAGIMATKNILRMDVILENDSCKILLNNIKSLR